MASGRKRWGIAALTAVCIIAAYGLTRLLNLTLLPIFTDEAIYIRWSQIGSRDAAWRFISLVDGKQPMFTWIMMVLLRFIGDPLTAGRLVSVLAGLGSLVGITLLSWELFKSRRTSAVVAALYVISPFTLMYDRLALYDSLVASFYIWNLYLAILLVRRMRLDIALLLGMVLGAGMLNKSSGFLSLYLLPSTLIFFDWKAASRLRRLFQWIGFVFVAAFLSQVIYAILRLSPLFAMVGQKDLVFIYSFREWLIHPFKFLVGNIKGLFDWLTHYMTWPVFIATLISIWFMPRKWKEYVLLLVWWFAPFVALAMFGRVLYPRFILFMTMPLFVLAGVTLNRISRLRQSSVRAALFFLIFLPSVYADYYILTNPKYAPLPFSEKSQLIDDWPSGWGVREVNAFITKQAEAGEVAVYTEGTFGLFPYAIEMYQVDNPKVTVKGIWPVPQVLPEELEALARTKPVYIVFNQTQEIPPWPLEFISEYQKGNREDVYLRLYRIALPEPERDK